MRFLIFFFFGYFVFFCPANKLTQYTLTEKKKKKRERKTHYSKHRQEPAALGSLAGRDIITSAFLDISTKVRPYSGRRG